MYICIYWLMDMGKKCESNKSQVYYSGENFREILWCWLVVFASPYQGIFHLRTAF